MSDNGESFFPSKPVSKWLFALLRCVLADQEQEASLFAGMEPKDWRKLMALSGQQGVTALCLDALEQCAIRPDHDLLLEWVGLLFSNESNYTLHLNAIKKLSAFFHERQMKMVLLKGYGLSLNYPHPNHRPMGDIDLFHCGQGERADRLVSDQLGIDIKQNEEKHSTYTFEGVHVENHATIICELEHSSLYSIERFLEDELKNHSLYDETSGCMLPSATFNAVYLPLHFGGHFVFGGANLRQVVDYALMVKKNYQSIDWNHVKQLAEDGGFFRFLCCLNGICMDQLGSSASYFPEWERETGLQTKVFDDILMPQPIAATSILGRAKRYFANRWKFKLVFGKESHLKGFFLRLRSWLIWKWGFGRKSVWKKRENKLS